MSTQHLEELIQKKVVQITPMPKDKKAASIQKKREKLMEKLHLQKESFEINWQNIRSNTKENLTSILEYIVESGQLELLDTWRKQGLPMKMESSSSLLEYALKKDKSLVLEYVLSNCPYEGFAEHAFVHSIEEQALDIGEAESKKIFAKNYVATCARLAEYLNPIRLSQAIQSISKNQWEVPNADQWGKLYLSKGRLSYALEWCILHPEVAKKPEFWDFLLQAVASQKISFSDTKERVNWRLMTHLVEKNMEVLPQKVVNFLYKESVRLDHDQLFLILFLKEKKPEQWIVPADTPGQWSNVRHRSAGFANRGSVHLLHYAIGLGGVNGYIVDCLSADPEVLESLKNYKPTGGALAALDSIEVRKLSKLGCNIEQPLDEQGNRLLHYWAISDGTMPRSGWATMMKRFPGLLCPNDSGVTGLEAQRKILKVTPNRLRDFDLSLVKAESKDLERVLDKSGDSSVEQSIKKPKIL